jgi:hypothetical protein
MEWKTLDALLEGEEPDEMYLFLREVGIVFEMSVEQVMANAEITLSEGQSLSQPVDPVTRCWSCHAVVAQQPPSGFPVLCPDC